MNSETNNQLLTLPEVAARLRCHVVTVRRYIRARLLKAKKLQRRYRVSAAELESFLAADKPRVAAEVLTPGFPTRWLPLDDRGAKRLRGYRRMARAAKEAAGRHPALLGVRDGEVVAFMVLNPRRTR
jgi:excisionase family DNA binding protein